MQAMADLIIVALNEVVYHRFSVRKGRDMLSKKEILALSQEEQKAMIDDESYQDSELEFLQKEASKEIKNYYNHRRVISKILESGITPDEFFRNMFE